MPGTALQQWERLADAFAAGDPGRSILLAPYRHAADAVARRADLARPGGSILKVPLVASVLAAAARRELDLEQQVPVATLPSSQWASVANALPDTLSLSLIGACALAITTSDNPCSDFLTRLVGADYVNQWMQGVGLSAASRFAGGFTDQEISARGSDNRTTALDCLRLFDEIFSNDIYAPLRRFLFNNIRNQRIPRLLSDNVQVAHKTGSLAGVVNDAGLIVQGDTVFIAVFLCEDQADPLATEDAISRIAHESLVAVIAGSARGRDGEEQPSADNRNTG